VHRLPQGPEEIGNSDVPPGPFFCRGPVHNARWIGHWNSHMTSPLTLCSATARCVLLPDRGGSVAGLWLGDWRVLQAPQSGAPASGLDTASYPLVPYSNRIGLGLLEWHGMRQQLAPLFAPEPHTIHGVGWSKAWQVVLQSETEAILCYAHPGDAGWPFVFEVHQHFVLSANALSLTMTVRNTDTVSAPFGLGWHPYFPKDAATRIEFQATGRWDMGPDQLPTTHRPHAGLQTDCAQLQVDHCFSGWSGPAQLHYPGHRIAVTSDLQHLVVFTHPGRDTIAVEPVSHANNALQLAGACAQTPESLGLRVVAPGAQTSAYMRITFEEQI